MQRALEVLSLLPEALFKPDPDFFSLQVNFQVIFLFNVINPNVTHPLILLTLISC